jgi:hypothetical protein
MPVVATVDGVRIEVYFDDHPPPHFHARYAGEIAAIAIKSGQVVAGRLLPPILRKIRAWARPRQDALLTAWYKCRLGEYPETIA